MPTYMLAYCGKSILMQYTAATLCACLQVFLGTQSP